MSERVLHICSDTNIGGAGRYVLALLGRPEIADRFEVAVACPEGQLAAALRRAGVPVMLYPGADLSFSVTALWALYGLVRSWRPRIVHTHGSLAGRLAGRLGGARVAFTKHGLAAAEEQAVQIRSVGGLARRAAVRLAADRIVAVSAAVRQALVAQGADPGKVRVISGGVEVDAYAGVGPLVPGVIGGLGRLSYEKGFDLLLSAMRELGGEVRLLLGGDGPQRERLAAEAAGLERVTLTGFVPDVAAFMGKIGLFVLPSRSEGLGLVLVEAMAAGRPVVATRVGGVPEVVADGETGLLVPPEDSGALAAAVRRLLENPDLADRMGAAGRGRAEALFSARRMAEQTRELYLEMLS